MAWLSRLPVVPFRLISYQRAASGSCAYQSRHVTTASSEKKKAYSHTLLLPKTDFPLKHKDVVAAEKRYRSKTADELYKEQAKRKENPLFVLHDGPPYANGHLHMGHALNKVLKDIINRYVPGWDCHGLPIEQKALAAIGKSHTSLEPTQVREEARKVALEAIDIQKTEMKALGVMADWDGENGTYRTLAEIIQDDGGERLRPTYYSPSSRTALAEAELSYKDGHKSRSVYVGFPVDQGDMSEGLREVYERDVGRGQLELAVWTTTPWTLPANMLIVTGSELVGTRYTHLFHPASSSRPRPVVFAANHVTAQAGTGLVHSAPAHGYEDYEAFIAAGILPEELRCPVDDDGCFTMDLVSWAKGDSAASLVGQQVLGKGTDTVIELLRKNSVLLAEQQIEHRYPYDWKSKKPIIVRATPQWFADVEGVKTGAVHALESVHFHPAQYSVTLEHIIAVLDREGIDHWWKGPIEDFVPAGGTAITRGYDTLDVWFDSGSSWTMLEERSGPVADVYLEGSDQHRGWFQSSLLTKLISSPEATAPYGTVITHGFVMDEQGDKMSKSAGNGLSPMEIIHGSKVSTKSSVDYTNDVAIGPSSISNATEAMRKLRNSMRYLLANTGADVPSLGEVTLRPTLHRMTRILAPIAPHFAEELYEHMGGKEASVFLVPWTAEDVWSDPTIKAEMSRVLSIRAEVQQLVEKARAEK
ncbi:uncharacterized protein IL334_004971 [Kwoniella shivajii]|uniref:isoleucine--tRNA ligase n=1 Tax=Kwoniella shivajii TaxID=564305 RepID=A0ABZ1D2A5_9TREE|nr:hypothetical protein IL334_004971 [Kwoniella shivajii]